MESVKIEFEYDHSKFNEVYKSVINLLDTLQIENCDILYTIEGNKKKLDKLDKTVYTASNLTKN